MFKNPPLCDGVYTARRAGDVRAFENVRNEAGLEAARLGFSQLFALNVSAHSQSTVSSMRISLCVIEKK